MEGCAEQAGAIPDPGRLVPERPEHPSPKMGHGPLRLSILLRFWKGALFVGWFVFDKVFLYCQAGLKLLL